MNRAPTMETPSPGPGRHRTGPYALSKGRTPRRPGSVAGGPSSRRSAVGAGPVPARNPRDCRMYNASVGARFIAPAGWRSGRDHTQRLADPGERVDRALEVGLLVCRADLYADARLPLGDDGEREPDHVDALGEHRVGHARGEGG